MNNPSLRIGHLYPKSMNTYGDTGNILCLQYRAKLRGIPCEVFPLEVGDAIPDNLNLYFFGGGQDAAQGSLGKDLLTQKGTRIKDDIQAGIPLLSICGGYQLLGQSYHPFDQEPITGLGLFPVETHASNDRMIGNLIIQTNPSLHLDPSHPKIVGFENHSGKTLFQNQSAQPLGKVLKGFGNNGKDKTEGCLHHNAIGCYLHGSVLPKNPHLADWLTLKALQQDDPELALTPLADQLEWQAHDYVVARYS